MLKYCWIFILPVLVCSIVSINDSRFLYLSFILLLIIYPMVLSMVWIKLCAKPGIILLSRPQMWTFLPCGGLKIDFYSFDSTAIVDSLSITAKDILSVNFGEIISVNLRKPIKGIRFLLVPADRVPDNFPQPL